MSWSWQDPPLVQMPSTGLSTNIGTCQSPIRLLAPEATLRIPGSPGGLPQNRIGKRPRYGDGFLQGPGTGWDLSMRLALEPSRPSER